MLDLLNKSVILHTLITLTAIVSHLVAFEITWSRYKNSRSITLNATSFSVTDDFTPHQDFWVGFSVLGERALAYNRFRTFAYNFSAMCRRDMIDTAYHKSNGDDSCGPGLELGEPERYVFDGDILKSSLGGRENFITYETNGYFVFMLDENKYTVSGPSLPEELERVFIDDDMMAIVEKDGNTIMRPIESLIQRFDHDELFREIRRSIEPVESSRRMITSSYELLAKMEKHLSDKIHSAFDDSINSHLDMMGELESKIDVYKTQYNL